jgi:hypothetical protein
VKQTVINCEWASEHRWPQSRIAFLPRRLTRNLSLRRRNNVAAFSKKVVVQLVGSLVSVCVGIYQGSVLRRRHFKERIPFSPTRPNRGRAPKPVEEPFVQFEQPGEKLIDPARLLATDIGKVLNSDSKPLIRQILSSCTCIAGKSPDR